MEDPEYHWDFFFDTPEHDLTKACLKHAAEDAEFSKYLNITNLTYWGWKMELRNCGKAIAISK